MIDAGASATPSPASLDIRPNAERRPGEWIGRYARRHLTATGEPKLDAFLVSHLHPDHIGDVGPDTPLAPGGAYRLTGLSDVAALLPIGVLVDRDWPDYAFPGAWDAPFARNYIAFVRERVRAGGRSSVSGGRGRPVDAARRRGPQPGGQWRGLDGRGAETRRLFPPIAQLAKRSISPTRTPARPPFGCAMARSAISRPAT